MGVMGSGELHEKGGVYYIYYNIFIYFLQKPSAVHYGFFRMPPVWIILIGLLLAGALSPLLTFAALFQQKEWRWDRLREHLRRDGAVNQLFGRVRPALYGLFVLLWIAALPRSVSALALWTGLFAVLSAVQLGLKRQRMPVWTSKAKLIIALSVLLTVIAAILTLAVPVLMPGIILLQPLFVLAAWLILKPLDYVLKKRVMDRAAAHRATLTDATVIAVAGSVGKTTTKELIAHLLTDLRPAVTPAHVNTEMGVAQWLTGKKADVFVVEMGAYRLGEIALLCRIAQPTVGVMTALGSDHLALFGSEEAIVRGNGELIEFLPEGSHAFLYGENPGCRSLAQKARSKTHLTGEGDLLPTDIHENDQGISFKAGGSTFQLPLQGRHNVHNALLAIGVARQLGVRDERIKELLKTFRGPAHTFNMRTERGVLLLDDTYNISPLSVGAALDWAARQTHRPRVLLTSGLQETGDEEARFLKELGAKAKGSVERVVFTAAHGADAFGQGFGAPVEVLNPRSPRVAEGSVLLAVGRMPPSTVQRLLPADR